MKNTPYLCVTKQKKRQKGLKLFNIYYNEKYESKYEP